ncbi:glycoside hydrolase [Planctomycetales bacterium]|nr:glycoside hydrolase [Planctomycetales bacterium]
MKQKIKVGLIVDEYFGALGTAYGGYGFLARHLIAKFLPNEDIQVEVLLQSRGNRRQHFFAKKHIIDGITVWQPPSDGWCRSWLDRRDYDVYLSVEITHDILRYDNPQRNRRVIHWIQDPTTARDWVDCSTMDMFVEPPYWNSALYDTVHSLAEEGRVRFISQGHCLNEKAKELYSLRYDVPIEYVPNPVEFDETFPVESYRIKNQIVFLGRIESVKRGWLFCEAAKLLPEYEFYMVGQTFRYDSSNEKNIAQYKQGIPNLHFTGLLEGSEKEQILKNSKILVNTSIREGIPISYLEALSYGTLLVSGCNAESLPERFGVFIGKYPGNGFESVEPLANAVRDLITNEERHKNLSAAAVNYIRQNHGVKRFQDTLRPIIEEEYLRRRQKHRYFNLSPAKENRKAV